MPNTFLLIGPPGSGKTTTSLTLEYPTLLIDVDNKAKHMQHIQPLIKKGDVVILPIKSPLVEDSLRYRALNPDKGPQTQPEGFLETIDILNEIGAGAEKYKPFATIVLDTLTRLCEHMVRLLIYLRGKGKFGTKIDGDMNWPSWGSYKSMLEEVFTEICKIEDKNFICNVHQMTETKTVQISKNVVDIIETGIWPMIDGQMRKKLAGYFCECYFLEALVSAGEPIYQMRVLGRLHKCARSTMNLPEIVPSNLGALVKEYGNK